MSYTKEMTKEIVEAYTENPTRETVDALAEKFEKSVKSVIGKLSREGVYRREVYTTKTGEKPVTKLELVAEISSLLEVDDWRLEGLEKAPKQALKIIRDGVKAGSWKEELNEGLGDMGPLAGNRVEEWQHIREKGFPVRVNRVKPILGKISFNKEVLGVKEQSLSPDLFLPPEDYEMVKSPPMPPVGPRGKMPVPPEKTEQGSPQ